MPRHRPVAPHDDGDPQSPYHQELYRNASGNLCWEEPRGQAAAFAAAPSTFTVGPPASDQLCGLNAATIDWSTPNVPYLAWVHAVRAQGTVAPGSGLIPAWEPEPAGPQAPPPGQFRVGGRLSTSAQTAANALTPGAALDIGPETYTTPIVVRVSAVSIVGHGRVIFQPGAAQGKAAFLIAANRVRMHNIECRLIEVPDGNGACIRFEGNDLTVEGVHFHEAQEGILAGSASGAVRISGSRFERHGAGGQAHGISIGGGKLVVTDSLFLSSQGQGHEVKSRAAATIIVRSVICSFDAIDSPLIVAPNGGLLAVTDSLLLKGPNSATSAWSVSPWRPGSGTTRSTAWCRAVTGS